MEDMEKDRIIKEQEEKIREYEERLIEVGEMEDEPANCGMLRQRTRSLPKVEKLQEEMGKDTYHTLEKIMSECLNRIDNAADCSKGMQGAKVHQIRKNARMV